MGKGERGIVGEVRRRGALGKYIEGWERKLGWSG